MILRLNGGEMWMKFMNLGREGGAVGKLPLASMTADRIVIYHSSCSHLGKASCDIGLNKYPNHQGWEHQPDQKNLKYICI